MRPYSFRTCVAHSQLASSYMHKHVTLLQDGFLVITTSGQRFENVDLSDGEWVEYDEKLGESVGIMELEHKLVVHK